MIPTDLSQLVIDISEDGKVDADEVNILRSAIFADGVVDRDEANALFDLNDLVNGADNDPSYEKLFIEAITSHLLDDEDSPNEIDADEAAWLIEKVEGDGIIDGVEHALLVNIKKKATSIAPALVAKFTEWNI